MPRSPAQIHCSLPSPHTAILATGHVGPSHESPPPTQGGAMAASGPKVATGKVPSGILVAATHRQGRDHLAQEGSLGGQRRRPSMELGDEGGGKRWAQWPWDMCQQRQQWSTCRAVQQERQPGLPTVSERGGQTLGKSPSSSGPRLLPANSSGRTHTQGWWDSGGLTQCNDERTELDTVGTLEGGICYCCCSCHHGQQMWSWALSPDTQPPTQARCLILPEPSSPHPPGYCSPKSAPPGTWLPAGSPWEQRGQLFPQSRTAGLSVGRAVSKVTVLCNPLYSLLEHLKLFQKEVYGTQQVNKHC